MTTAVQVQFRRGTQSQMAAFTGAAGEMNVDATNNRVVVQDGTTAGGWPAARLSEIAGGFLNKFRNGTMDVWQRGTSGLTSTTSGAYTADGWIVLPSGASVTAAQAGGRLVTKASLQVTGASAVTDLTIKQRIESLMAAAFCGQTVTVQAQLFNNTRRQHHAEAHRQPAECAGQLRLGHRRRERRLVAGLCGVGVDARLLHLPGKCRVLQWTRDRVRLWQ